MRPILAALLLLIAFLAGCTGEQSGEEDAAPTATEQPLPAVEENTPPTATLATSIDGGEVPFNVTFQMDGSDEDGDTLSWTLDVDGDAIPDAEGAELPAEHTHAYETEGVFTVTFTVSDGTDTAVQALVVNATAATVTPAPTEPIQTEELSWTAGNGGCGASYSDWVFGTPLAGITHAEFAVDPLSYGAKFTITFEVAGNPALTMIGIDFYGGEGTIPGSMAVIGDGAFDFLPVVELKGIVPDGAEMALVYDCGADGGSATYVAK